MITQIRNCLFAGIGIGIDAFLSVLPIYDQLNSFKEWLIANALGIDIAIVSAVLFILALVKVAKKIFR
ncbi:MAG: hypothetical protein J5955_03350 [Bacilli bacterium]|nr:hypothetical protein [Bacilli bacterium]